MAEISAVGMEIRSWEVFQTRAGNALSLYHDSTKYDDNFSLGNRLCLFIYTFFHLCRELALASPPILVRRNPKVVLYTAHD